MKHVLPLICVIVTGVACSAFAQPAVPEVPPVQQVPLTQADLMRLLGVNMWKWRLTLPAQTKQVVFVKQDWRKDEKEPRLTMIMAISLNPKIPPLASDLHDVMVRWTDSQTENITCAFDSNTFGIAPSSGEEPFKSRGFALRSNGSSQRDPKEVKLNEAFELVRAAYRSDVTYDGTEFAEGAEKKNERTHVISRALRNGQRCLNCGSASMGKRQTRHGIAQVKRCSRLQKIVVMCKTALE